MTPVSQAGAPERLLAFDTATDHLAIALRADGRTYLHDADGGPQASAALLPAIGALLARAGLAPADLQAIAFGRGPGAFTGLRTACAVAQGLALGTGRPALPIDTLQVVAEEGRAGAAGPLVAWAAMDARMDEVYAARYAWGDAGWTVLQAPLLTTPEALVARWRDEPPDLVCGNAVQAFGARLDTGRARCVPALPRARALLPVADAAWAAGGAVDAALVLPLYLRDKVAQTTVEREAARAAKLAAGAAHSR